MTDTAAAAVGELIERAVRAGRAPGVVAGWLRSGDVDPVVVAAGAADLGPPVRKVAAEVWFDLASLTKPLVVAPLATVLVRNGALSLETRVGETLPGLSGSALGARRVRHLLTHTSGLPAWAPLYALASSPESRDVVAALAGLPVAEVGRRVVYSCPGFILLGLVLEHVTGTPLDQLASRLLLGPLGLADEIGYRPSGRRPLAAGAFEPAAERRLLVERGLDPEAVPSTGPGLPDDGNARFLGGVAGNAGLFGTVRGVLELAEALTVPGRLLGAEEIELSVRNHTPGLGQARGLGWQLAATPGCSAGPALDPSACGHTGFTGTSLWVDPTRRLSLVLLANRVHPAHRDIDLHPLRRRFHQVVVESL